jgi:hypothetical protein
MREEMIICYQLTLGKSIFSDHISGDSAQKIIGKHLGLGAENDIDALSRLSTNRKEKRKETIHLRCDLFFARVV